MNEDVIMLDEDSVELLEKLADSDGLSQEGEMEKLISDFCKENERDTTV